jgi:hypothetical protein
MLMMYILGGSVPTVKKNMQVLAVASKEMGLEVNAGKVSTWPFLEIRIQDDVTG